MATINAEGISKILPTKTIYSYFDENGNAVFKTKEVFSKQKKIILYPFSVNRNTGVVTAKKIKEITFLGWATEVEIPKDLKFSSVYSFTGTRMKPFITLVRVRFNRMSKITIGKNIKTVLKTTEFIFNLPDLEKILRGISKEKDLYDSSRKQFIQDSLSELSSIIPKRARKLQPGELGNFLGKYDSLEEISQRDINAVTKVLEHIPANKISVTGHFIATRDKLDIVYIEDLIKDFESHLSKRNENEEDWQKYFEKNAWLLSHLFPYQVILRKGKAYVGGKSLENRDGKIVDFLFRTGFKDNYALLEIKTHNKTLLKANSYREPDVFPLSDELSGGINQCLDQKSNFLTDMGQKYKSLDPKVILIIGLKEKLTELQTNCFELLRANQKNVDIVTFDELLSKLKTLHEVIKGERK